MPRSQKHHYKTRYSLEKLRLDVALKRSRLLAAQQAAPKAAPPLPYDPELQAVKAQREAVDREIHLARTRSGLKFAKTTLDGLNERLLS